MAKDSAFDQLLDHLLPELWQLLKISGEGVHIHPQTESLQDKGYQGIQKLYPNSRLPTKKPKGAL